MQRVILSLVFCLLKLNPIFSQTISIAGEWKLLEMNTDRLFINFQTDSIYLFDKDDQEKYSTNELKHKLIQDFALFSQYTIRFERDSTYTIDFMGQIVKGFYKFNPELSQISIQESGNTVKSDTLKLTSKGLMEHDMSDDYEKKIMTFKRVIN